MLSNLEETVKQDQWEGRGGEGLGVESVGDLYVRCKLTGQIAVKSSPLVG